jgi:hypothetical protein
MSSPRFLTLLLLALPLAAQDQKPATKPADKPGYDDTPVIPGSQWKVHDKNRPHPAVVEPGTASAEQPGKPPADAVVLFDGKDLSGWKGGRGDAKWKVEDGAMVVNGTGDIETKLEFGDCQLHIEWATPAKVEGSSQGRGNSGVFLMGRYELQVLDSYDNVTYADGQAAAIYAQAPPLVNACRKPGEWQTYDIVFEGPRFEGDKLVKPARITVFHNGVLVHNARELTGQASHRAVGTYAPHPPQGPLKLQDHGNPVRYRNIWMRKLNAQ